MKKNVMVVLFKDRDARVTATIEVDAAPAPGDGKLEPVSEAPEYVLTVSVESLLQQLAAALGTAQRGPFKSRAQALAITKIEESMHWLRARYQVVVDGVVQEARR